jgi:hypothetical protein
MSKPKRYENEQQILNDIDKYRKMVKGLIREAEVFDRFAEVMRDFPDFPIYGLTRQSKFIAGTRTYREYADKAREKSGKVDRQLLPKLSDALATIKTGIFPEIITDESVVVK